MPPPPITRTKKIKGIIAANIHKGEQFCADRINSGGFPAPGFSRIWKPEHIKPMMAGKISMKPAKKIAKINVATPLDRNIADIIFRNSVTSARFLRDAIAEKIERDGLL